MDDSARSSPSLADIQPERDNSKQPSGSQQCKPAAARNASPLKQGGFKVDAAPIGKGSYGVVVAATDANGERVAIKQISDVFSSTADAG